MSTVLRGRRVRQLSDRCRFLLISVMATLAACTPGIPEQELRPTLATVVTGVEFGEGRLTTFSFADGSALELDLAKVDQLSGGQPIVNDLLLYGRDPERGEWYVALGGGEDCYELVGPAEFRGEFGDGRMVFESGLSLPLADDFSPGRPSDPRVSERAHICVDEDGEVVSYSTT